MGPKGFQAMCDRKIGPFDCCSVVQGDCLELMKQLPDGCVDAVITDPPWFTPASHYQSRVQWQRNYGDLSPLKVWWDVMSKEMARTTARTGHALAFCSGDSLAAFYPGFYGNWPKMDTLVWDKKRPGLGAIWRGQHELIIAARNEESKRKDDGVLRGDVLAYEATPSAERDHPVQKPVELYSDLITATTAEGDLVFDPFLGSGTLAVAATKLGRHFLRNYPFDKPPSKGKP
jgi:site-specific DNA-methyltransferase (adenine-specific)